MSGDGLRDEIARAICNRAAAGDSSVWNDYDRAGWYNFADAVLPVVQARIDAAREQVVEQIAQAIEAQLTRRGQTPKFYTGLRAAADIARQHGKGDGDG